MSEETTDVNLDDFSAEFFGQKEAPEPASSTEEVETDTVETQAESEPEVPDEPEAEVEDEADADADHDEPEAKPKKNRAQDRIRELNTKFQEERRARSESDRVNAELLARIEKLENKNEQAAPPPKEEAGPTPTDQNEDGTDKYPLGEFDPNYIRDLTRHTLQKEREEWKAREAEESKKREADNQLAELQTGWNSKLEPARERYPDFNEKGEQLFDTFSEIPQDYGEYLASTIMSMEHGPDVLYYLANNLEEADRIVKSGATMATLHLGRLEAKFVAEDKQLRVSKAPAPPPTNKGVAPVKSFDPNTEDLDVFSKEFFKK